MFLASLSSTSFGSGNIQAHAGTSNTEPESGANGAPTPTNIPHTGM